MLKPSRLPSVAAVSKVPDKPKQPAPTKPKQVVSWYKAIDECLEKNQTILYGKREALRPA